MATDNQESKYYSKKLVKKKASDLHLQVGLPPMLRVDGALAPVTGADALDEETVETLIFAILDEDQKQILLKDKEFDFSFAFGDLGRFRVNAFHERGNLAAALRLDSERNSDHRAARPAARSSISLPIIPRGLVLVTGPTGSGKSTTLAALVHKINTEQSQAHHYHRRPDRIHAQVARNRSSSSAKSTTIPTRSARRCAARLREDPDVVLIGEMRDLETIASAITIAETGHLVFATLHTNSAAQSIDRMIDVFPPHQQPQIRAQLS